MSQANQRTLPLWKSVYEKLHVELASYAYGSDFYTAGQVCKKFDVSQITAVRVLNELARRHLIEKIPGRGSVVRRLNQAVAMRMILPDIQQQNLLTFDYPSSRRFDGIATATREQGIDFSVLSETHLERLFPRQREEVKYGFLLLHQTSSQTLQFLKSQNLPFVLVDPLQHYKGLPYARVDRTQAGYLATRHLLDQGHKRIAWITASITQRNFRQRVTGYRRALSEVGIRFDWSLLKTIDQYDHTEASQKHFTQFVKQLMALRRPPTAILAGDDTRAMYILNACQELGIDVPGQMSVVGYPNYPESSLTNPPLTVVDAHFEKTGQVAVGLLLEQMLGGADPSKQAVVIKPQLVERSSVSPPASSSSSPNTELAAV